MFNLHTVGGNPIPFVVLEEDFSNPIIIPRGFLHGNIRVTIAYVSLCINHLFTSIVALFQVNKNGDISFGSPTDDMYIPPRFPTLTNRMVIAPPVLGIIDENGSVLYATYYSATDYNPNSKALLDAVNANIQSQQGEESRGLFVGLWILIARWDGVHLCPHGSDHKVSTHVHPFVNYVHIECSEKADEMGNLY